MTALLTKEKFAIGAQRLPGELVVPEMAAGVVVFAHGSGSGRLSPRNRYVAEVLQAYGLGTLLFDLLTDEEAADRANVFDIPLLAARVGDALAELAARDDVARLPVGVFGASTGAAAALVAAARHPAQVVAVVSRGGRADLAADVLGQVQAPTLLIVGGDDRTVLQLNGQALQRLRCEKRLEIVPGATHLFEEPGALDQVARLAANWFAGHFVRKRPRD